MKAWFAANGGTLLIVLVLLAIVTLVIRKLVRDKKSGATACGCGCEHCALHDKCHPANK